MSSHNDIITSASSKQKPEITVKRIIGDYRIEKTIGEGTFGKVKLGYHIPTEEPVAIKILEKDKIQDKEDLDRISREIKFLKKLNHPNIIKIYDIRENSNNFYIIMEFAKGGELFNHIVKQKRLDESEAAFYFTQIICGLEVIHKNNIVHRDIKPENLLLKENNILTIIDFGLSNQYKQGKTLSTPCGSPCYAAPEMILGRKYNGLMVDLWSSGIVLYAMVCGYLPFEDKNNDKLYKKILNGKFEIPEHLSMECRDLLKKILTVSPKKRINLEDIKSHPFLALASPTYKVDESTINREKGVYNEIIIDKMVNGMPGYDFRKDEILFHLSHNKHNNITTTYELLLKKYITNSNTHNKHNKDNLSGITATTSMQSISLNTTVSPVKVGTECKIDANVYNVLKSPVITNILPKINIDATTSNIIATSTTNTNKRSRKGFSVGESKSTSNENKFIHKITTTITTHNNNNNSNNNSTNIHNNKKQKHNKHYHNSTSKNKSKNDISLDVSKIINKNKIDSNIIICVPHLVPINKKAFAKLSTRTKRISTSKLISSNTNIHNSNNKLSPNRKHSNSSNRTNSNKNINTSINYETTPKRFHHLSKAKSKNMQMIYIPSNTINLEDDGCMNNSHGQIKYNAHKRKSNSKSNNTSKNKYSKCKNNNSNSNFNTQNIISIKASTPLKQKNKNYSNVYIHKITNENSYKLIHRSYSVNNNNNNNNNDCAQSPKSDGASMKSIQFHNNSNNSLNYINKIYGSFCEEYINCRSENNNSNNNNINNSNNPNNNSYNLSLSSLIKKNKSQKSIQSNQSNNTAKTNLTISKNKQNQKQNKQIVASTIKAQPQVKKQHKIIHRHQVNININKTKENNHNINNSTSNHNSLMCNSPTKKKETINSTRASYCPSFTENMSPIFNLDKMLISNKSNFSNSSNNTVNTVVSSISTNKNLKTPNKKNSNISITIKKVNSSKRGIKGQSTSPSVSSSSSLNKRSKGKRSSKGNITSTNTNNPSFRVKLTVIGIDITEEIEKNKQKNKTNITSSNTKQKQQQQTSSSTTSSTNKKQTNINNNNNKKQKQKSKESNSIGVNSCDSEGCLIKSKKRKVTSPLEIQFDLEDDVEMKQKILTTSKDLAICTVSSTIEQINEKLNILCQNNGYTLTEVDKTKYICKKNSDNSINIEISQVGNNNVLKLYHLNGQESITKEIIKNIIIHIGF